MTDGPGAGTIQQEPEIGVAIPSSSSSLSEFVRETLRAPNADRSVKAGVAVFVAYYIVAIAAFWPVLPFDNSHMLATAPNDSTAVGWFLSYAGFAVSHLHNPFFTNWMDFPTGINIPANQSMPLLGLILTPITLWLGPFAMINFAMSFSLVASAVAMYLTLRYFRLGRVPAFIGGLFYGFSPMQAAHSLENPNFTFLFVLPFIFLLAYRLTLERTSPRRDGVLLGICLAAQLYLNPEPLAELLTVLIVTMVLVSLLQLRHLALSNARQIGKGVFWSAVTFVPLAAPFAYYFLAGPQHTSGPVVPFQYLDVFHTDLAQLITPDSLQLIGPAHLMAIADSFSGGALNETGSYLGIPLIVGLVFILVRWRRHPMVQFAGFALAVASVLSLGPRLYVDNHVVNVPLPERLLQHVPFLESAEAIRYFIVADLAVAVLIAFAIDQIAFRQIATNRMLGATARRVLPACSAVVLSSVLLFPLIPRWPDRSYQLNVPSYFTSSMVRAIAPGATVFSYPVPQSGAVQPLQWQMAAEFRFKLVDGYGYVANNGGLPLGNPPLVPPTLATVENLAWQDAPATSFPALTDRNLLRVRRLLRNVGVDDFLLLRAHSYKVVDRFLTLALGKRPQSVGGMLVWYGLPALLRSSLHTVIEQDQRLGLIPAHASGQTARPSPPAR